jgi:exodeoxyribonuclease V gamma subunit
MEKRPTVHFSNRLEELANSLGEELFAQGSDPFATRIVLLPNHSLKLYLSSFFASHPRWHVCAGITFQTLVDGALSFCKKQNMLSSLALSFAIQQELSLLQEGSWDELDMYLKSSMKSSIESRAIWLSQQLSRLFYEYGTFEGKALQKWTDKKGWKQWLWHKVHDYTSFFSEEMTKVSSKFSGQIHLFGFSHIPSHFYEFFCSIGAEIYFLSPSAFFWEDFCSDKERIFLEKKMEGKKVRLQVQEQITFFLKENHPLLANWGKVGRSLVKQLGDTESYLEELYKDPREKSSSLLSQLQSEMLYLEGGKKEISLQDTSILCLSATSKLREVEVLLETLQEYMISDPDLQPKDILVLCSDLDGYFPYIQMVFGSSNSPIDYSIHGLSLALAEENVQALQFFFSLAESRFDRAQIFQFFSYPSVMKKWGWTILEVKEWEDWVEKARVLWGWDSAHKKLCLDQVWPENSFIGEEVEQGTWEEGLCRLIQGLAMNLDSLDLSPEEIPSFWPVAEVDWTQTELLGKFIQVLLSLKDNLRPVYQKELKTLAEWIICVQGWVDTYFEKTRVEEALLRDLDNFKV